MDRLRPEPLHRGESASRVTPELAGPRPDPTLWFPWAAQGFSPHLRAPCQDGCKDGKEGRDPRTSTLCFVVAAPSLLILGDPWTGSPSRQWPLPSLTPYKEGGGRAEHRGQEVWGKAEGHATELGVTLCTDIQDGEPCRGASPHPTLSGCCVGLIEDVRG